MADVSGSMSLRDKLYVEQAVNGFINKFRGNEKIRIGIIFFSDQFVQIGLKKSG